MLTFPACSTISCRPRTKSVWVCSGSRHEDASCASSCRRSIRLQVPEGRTHANAVVRTVLQFTAILCLGRMEKTEHVPKRSTLSAIEYMSLTMWSHIAREKFDFSAHAERDNGVRKQNMTVIQKIRQMSSYPQFASSFSMSTLLFSSVTCNAMQCLHPRQYSLPTFYGGRCLKSCPSRRREATN